MPINTNQLDAAVALLDASLSDADAANQPGWGAPLVAPKSYFVNHRKVLDVCCGVDPANGTAAAEWVAGVIRAQLPATYAIYTAPGESDGSGGGLDVSNPATVAFVNQLVSSAAASTPPAPFTAAMATALIALGQSSTLLFGVPVAAADVTASRARLARQSAVAALGQKVMNAAASFVNEKVNPATDPSQPMPAWTDFQAAVAAEN